jgi:hypothetical protein
MADKLSRSPVLGLIALVKFLLNFCAFWVHFLRNYYSSSTSISHICRSDQAINLMFKLGHRLIRFVSEMEQDCWFISPAKPNGFADEMGIPAEFVSLY